MKIYDTASVYDLQEMIRSWWRENHERSRKCEFTVSVNNNGQTLPVQCVFTTDLDENYYHSHQDKKISEYGIQHGSILQVYLFIKPCGGGFANVWCEHGAIQIGRIKGSSDDMKGASCISTQQMHVNCVSMNTRAYKCLKYSVYII